MSSSTFDSYSESFSAIDYAIRAPAFKEQIDTLLHNDPFLIDIIDTYATALDQEDEMESTESTKTGMLSPSRKSEDWVKLEKSENWVELKKSNNWVRLEKPLGSTWSVHSNIPKGP
ncbi:hypothetical protein BJ138DRAFT_1119521 [Hygrophoropsis aurantiaca]|uniref:Uncharacterized protein n=1 Tax=Hygrophoropsis aurantiaca TaxID=72124 RepID=A0ACB7ZTG8_9AGAM|nr:hypothetical protein BJ138DRAFT_1119521 [Hygrophoropsis aurantiaca]